MKKLVFLVLIGIALVGCKGQNEKDNPEFGTTGNEKYDPKFGTKENKVTLIDYLERKDSLNYCGDVLVIKGSIVNEFPNFDADNSTYYPTENQTDQAICGAPKFYIDVTKILDQKQDFDKSFLASWLKKYGKYICFEETNEIILCAHEITDKAHYEYVNLCKVLDSMTVGQIKQELDSQSNQADFLLKDCYQQYMNFKFSNPDKKISFLLEPKYQNKGDYFSIPLFRSIVEKYNLNNGSSFEFLEADYYGVKDRIVFAITDSNNKKHFYDFSQIPPLGGTSVLYKSFSPL